MNPNSRTSAALGLRATAMVILLGLLGGCVSSAADYGPGDPYEGVNRPLYQITDFVDRKALVPVARGYSRITPNWFRTGVTNFFSNLRNVDSIVNGLLQGKPKKAGTDLARVLVNSTVGIGGLIDVGTRVGLEHGREDLGQTFAVWGYKRPPYVFFPAGGPSSVRDLPGSVIQGATPRLLLGSTYNIWVGLLDFINTRASALALTDTRDSSALDGYAFTKDAFYQRRKFLIFDGDPPIEDFFDEDFDEEFDDEGEQ